MKTTAKGKPLVVPVELKRALARSPRAKVEFDKLVLPALVWAEQQL